MERLRELLRGARRIEFWIFAAAVCALLALVMGEAGVNSGAGGSAGSTSTEARMERLLSRIDGAGRVTVMLSGEEDAPTGAVVVADGAGDVRVALELQRSLRALTGLELERIEIVQSKG